MSDGQIWLDDSIATYPPMDPQRSITRIGIGADTPSRADAPAIRRIAEGTRLELVQASRSSMTGTETSNSASQRQLRKHRALLLAMHQPPGAPIRRLSDSCTALLVAKLGYLDTYVGYDNIQAANVEATAVIQNVLLHVQSNVKDVIDEIDITLDISNSSKTRLTESIAKFFEQQKN
jgi:F0F1-type ATP synthase alpha subunit